MVLHWAFCPGSRVDEKNSCRSSKKRERGTKSSSRKKNKCETVCEIVEEKQCVTIETTLIAMLSIR